MKWLSIIHILQCGNILQYIQTQCVIQEDVTKNIYYAYTMNFVWEDQSKKTVLYALYSTAKHPTVLY